MKNDSNVYVGLDVHKDSIVAAYAVEFGEIQSLGNTGVLERVILPPFLGHPVKRFTTALPR